MAALEWLWTFAMSNSANTGRDHPSARIALPAASASGAGTVDELQACRAELAACQLELNQAKQSLEEAHRHYAEFCDAMPVGYLTLDEKGHTLEINQFGADMLGRERSNMLGKHFISWLAEDERPQFIAHVRQAFQSRASFAIELKIKAPSGILRDVRLDGMVIEEPGKAALCHMLMTDMSESRRAIEAASLTSRIVECAAEGIMVTDARNVIQSVNRAFEKSTGYSAAEAIGHTPALLKSGRHDADFYREMWAALNKDGQWQGEVWNRHKSGETYPEWLSISAVKDHRQRVTHYVGIFSDAHTQEYILERLHYLAYYDGLTGLPNRRLFLDRLNMSLSHARRDKHLLAVMFVDLDHFKHINDSLGHKVGDGLLKAVAERLKACLRDGDTLARLGGDEFTVVLPALNHAEAACHVARKFLESCAQPLSIEGQALHISTSIGISIYPDDGEDADDLLHQADMAMYRIKEAGRNGYMRCGTKPGADR